MWLVITLLDSADTAQLHHCGNCGKPHTVFKLSIPRLGTVQDKVQLLLRMPEFQLLCSNPASPPSACGSG